MFYVIRKWRPLYIPKQMFKRVLFITVRYTMRFLLQWYLLYVLLHFTVSPPGTETPAVGHAITTESLTRGMELTVTSTPVERTTLFDMAQALISSRDPSPSRSTSPGINRVMTTKSMTKNTDFALRSDSATTTSTTDTDGPLIDFATGSSFRQVSCSLTEDTIFLKNCLPYQTNTDTSSILVAEIASALLDGDFTTCIRPFQFNSLLPVVANTQNTRGSSLLRIQVTGKGLDCAQPSTLLYVDLEATKAYKAIKQECPFVKSNHSADLSTCDYECQPLVLSENSMRFGMRVQRLAWLARSHQLEQLCDIRAFIWL